MYALISSHRIELPPGTVVRMPCSWQDYRILCESRGDSSIPRIKYLGGEILLMSPLPKHGRDAHLIANVVTALLDSENRNYEAFTPITIELPELRGIEPDYCFYINNWQAVVGQDRLQWGINPPPALVIEIDVTTYTDASDYLMYRVPEVWLLKKNRLAVYGLQESEYQLQGASRYFPNVDLHGIVAQCLETASERGSGVAIRELRQRLSQDVT
jgi:Uma2 family endonuclease